MKLYSASSEETLRSRKLLRDWSDAGFLTNEQYQRLEKETISDLRTTNIFLRLVLSAFTMIIVGAAAGLFSVISKISEQATGVSLLIFAAICYAAAEAVISLARLYRYGIEEALAACSVGFLCLGMQMAFFSGGYSLKPNAARFLIPSVGAAFSLWIWRRFGLWYAFPAAMIFVLFLPGYWTSSHSAQHVIVAVFYAIGLISVAAVRPRHCLDYLDDVYSLAEALLWLGIYLIINLQLSDILAQWWGTTAAASAFGKPFYWLTWVLIWCLPPIVLARGVREKDRFVIAAGAVVAALTLVSNKPYLGWQRHTWDPMVLGVLLTGTAFFIGRWLARGAGGIRHGFTAMRVSGNDQHWINAGAAVFGLLSPRAITPAAQTRSPTVRFGGGASGGGGAGGDF